MEQTFPWVETPSKLKAIKETKQDLQLTYPMDRLICGDVGFGKTEVAIRAAFLTAGAGRFSTAGSSASRSSSAVRSVRFR